MNRWLQLRDGWRELGKDLVLTGTGVAVILVQAFSSRPNGLLLGAGLALTVPSTWDHIKALLPSSGGDAATPGDGPASQSSPSAGELPPGSTGAGSGGE